VTVNEERIPKLLAILTVVGLVGFMLWSIAR
jgi:hypothetical protein